MTPIAQFFAVLPLFRFRAPKIREFLLLLFFLLATHSVTELVAQPSTQSEPTFTAKTFTTESGLRTNSVNNFMQDQYGALWLGGNEGIVHFNGISFRTFSSFSTQHSISTRFIKLIESKTLGIFAISEHGQLIKWSPDSLSLVPVLFTDSNILVRNISLNSRQELIIATSHGFFVITPSSPSPTPFLRSISTSDVYDFNVLNDDRILFYDSDSLQIVLTDGQKTIKAQTVHHGTVNYISKTKAFGKTFFGIGNRLYSYTDTSIDEFHLFEHHPDNPINGLTTGNNGSLLVSVAFEGVFEKTSIESPFKPIQSFIQGPFANPFHKYKNEILFYDLQNVFLNNRKIFTIESSIRNVLVDKEHNIWLATTSSGLIRLTENRIHNISTSDGLREKNIGGILQLRDGRKLVGTFGKGVEIIDDFKVKKLEYPPNSPLLLFTHAMLEQNDGSILIGAAGNPLIMVDISKNPPIQLESFRFGMNTLSLFEDSKNRIWIGTENGVFSKFADLPWKTIQEVPTPFNASVRMIKEDPQGNLYFCTSGDGLFIYDGFTWNQISTSQGLSSNFIRDVYVESDLIDQNTHYLWVATENNGLTWVKRENQEYSSVQITQSDGLHHNFIHNIVEDKFQRFWFGSNTGIFWVSKTQLNEFVAGKENHITSYVLDENDGMLNREMNGGIQNSVVLDHNQYLWYPSQNGVVVIDTKENGGNKQIPNTKIDLIVSDHHSHAQFDTTILIDEEHRDITLYFSNDSYRNPERNLFSYRLLPIETKWSEPTTNRSVNYSRLPPKNYIFEVKSTNNDGLWNETPATAKFSITPSFRETTLYYILWVLIGILLISGFYYLRIRLIRKNEERLQLLVDEKTTELQLERETTQEQAKKISQFEKSKSDLLISLSHEMRTPLSLLLHPIQELSTHRLIRNDPNLQRLTDMLDANTTRLQQLIENLLDLSQLKTEEIVLASDQFELTTHIKEIINSLLPELKQKQIHINLDFYEAPIFIRADQKRIRTSLYSILYYVISQCPNNSIVSCVIKEKDDTISLEIEGPGLLTQEVKQFIFEPFKAGVNISNIIGVGLSIVKLYSKAHGGDLVVDKENEGRLLFDFKLPKSRILETPQPSVATKAPESELLSPPEQAIAKDQFLNTVEASRQTVLLVEDSVDMRLILKLTLRKDYNIIEAEDGEQATHLLRENSIDLILSDYMMPNKNGLELLKFVRENAEYASTPFIMLSARAEEKAMLDAINQGADLYLIKPTSKDVLLAQIKRLLSTTESLKSTVEIENNSTEKTKAPVDERVVDSVLEKAKAVIEQHYANPEFSVEHLSEILKIERTNLFRKLKSDGDISPSELIQNIRMQHAKLMLVHKDFTVAEVAFSCGFSSPSYFSQSFKASEGITPRQFVKQHKE